MGSDNPFPPCPRPCSLTREDVIGYLIDVHKRGWSVFDDSEPAYGNSFVIELDDCNRLRLYPEGTGWIVSHRASVGRSLVGGRAESLIQLKACLEQPQFLGKGPPSTARIREGQPASNLSKIAQLIGSAKILAVHDPYLEDNGLDNLRAIAHLSNCIAGDIRLLTSSKGAHKLSESYVTAFFAEFGCTLGKIRKVVSGKPHRRFFLLSGGQSLIMGMSLNHVNKNEAIRVESDTEDRPFFEVEWGSSVPVF